MQLNLLDIAILIISIQLLVFALIFLLPRKQRSRGQNFLGLFFLSLSLNVLNLFFMHHSLYLAEKNLYLHYLGGAFAFMYSPAFYLYCRSVIGKNKLNKYHTLHFLPFLLFISYVLRQFTFAPEDLRIQFLTSKSFFSASAYFNLTLILQIQVLIYVIITIAEVRQYRRKLRGVLSCIERRNYSWLNVLIISLLSLWLFDLSRFYLQFTGSTLFSVFENILFGSFLVLCYLFIYHALTKTIFSTEFISIQPRKTSLSEELRMRYFRQLIDFMNHQKPYLNPELSLVELAREVSIPARSLSEVIKIQTGQNFYDFVNSYRIRESEQRFKNDRNGEFNILDILYEVGFNSKSSFNTAFKKNLGMTPTEFRKSLNAG